jgi:hypothetical protein
MPVTAKLSTLFYDRLGEEIANELVNWFNEVDATYRADLRELNEADFARFDVKLEQRTAELRADFDRRDAKLERRLAEVQPELGSRIACLDASWSSASQSPALSFRDSYHTYTFSSPPGLIGWRRPWSAAWGNRAAGCSAPGPPCSSPSSRSGSGGSGAAALELSPPRR